MLKKNRANQKGVTLPELMVTILISSIIGIVFTQMQRYIVRFTLISKAKQETVQESRTALLVMQKMIQQGSAATFIIDQSTSMVGGQMSWQPPYSRIYFQATNMNGTTREFRFYQIGRYLYMDYKSLEETSWKQKILTKNVRFMSFFYPVSDDNQLISISLTISKKTAEGKETFLQMALQKVRIMNS